MIRETLHVAKHFFQAIRSAPLAKCTSSENVMLISLFGVTSWFDTICNIVTRWVNFIENHLHEHELLLSDNNVQHRSILTQIYVFLVLFTIFHFLP